MQIEHKFPFKAVYFLEGRGLTTSFCIVYDYATSGHMELWSVYVLFIQFIHISIQYTYISVQYIYLFISNAVGI